MKTGIRCAAFLLAVLLCAISIQAVDSYTRIEIAESAESGEVSVIEVSDSIKIEIAENAEACSDSFSEELEADLAPFLEKYHLNESNFSMGYCYTATGETWYYNGDALMLGGSVYKLPLNMVVTEGLADGTFSENDRVGGYSLAQAQYMSLVHSNNEVSQAMQKYIVGYAYGYYYPYRAAIAKYSGFEPDELPDKYYAGNYFSAEFMVNTLSYLYDHAEDFETVLDYMEEAQPGAYFKRNNDTYPIAHKYGYFNGAINDVGIVYTPTPFLLAAFTYNTGNGETVLSELCSLMTDFTLELDAQIAAEEEARTQRVAELHAFSLHGVQQAAEAATQTLAAQAPEAARQSAPESVSESAPEAALPPIPESGAESVPDSADSGILIIAAVSAAALTAAALWARLRTRRTLKTH